MPRLRIQKKRELVKPEKPLWQRNEKTVAGKASRRKIWLSISLLVVLAVLVVAGFIYRSLTSGTWHGQEQFNFLAGAEGERLLLISLDPSSTKVLVLDLNPNIMITSVYGYGEYKIGSLLRLGRMEKLGNRLLVGSVGYTLGMKIADFVPHSVAKVKTIDAAYLRSLGKPMLFNLVGRPLGIVDVWRYLNAVSALRDDQIEVVTIHESRLAYSEPLADESTVYRIDQQRWDGYLQAQIHGTAYSNEKLGVSIINTTAHPGLAAALARVLLNAGIDVISVGESQDNLSRSALILNRPEQAGSQTVRLIRELLPGVDEKPKTDELRADLVVMLGEDYNDYLTKHP